MANTKDRILVYSTDPKDQAIISGQQEKDKNLAELKSLAELNKFIVIFRLESNGRGGKTVTVLDKLPGYEPFVKELTKDLKVKCGVGGSYKIDGNNAVIEIQGDKRDAIKKILDARKIKYKGM
jgi:translation initiation factor 1